MNVVNARRSGFYRGGVHLGQMDPSSAIMMDVAYGPEEDVSSPVVDYTPQLAPAPTVSVPKPSGSPVYATFGPYGTLDPTAVGMPSNTVSSQGTLPPGPAPRTKPLPPCPPGYVQQANVIATCSGSIFSSIPTWAWLALGGVVVLPLLMDGGRRRRR